MQHVGGVSPSREAPGTSKALEGLHYVSSLSVRRIDGIGPTLVGRFTPPDSSEWYFTQFAFTILLVPVYFGRFYAVQRLKKKGRGRIRGRMVVAGWLSGEEMMARYGKRAYWSCKLQAMLPLLFMALIFAAAYLLWGDGHMTTHR